ncbi:hypothetical protein LZS85_15550 [Aliivibrio fischeri]|uniref:hypothetical protein n=1 Tax=Aliivibrio fischeri TaxID=668 RepID=UPI001F1EBBA8|nr:hypothetical protein [Aliivibrio fischeri]MCE7567538.1 hypothetical protein [Aliivibrio fischeri]
MAALSDLYHLVRQKCPSVIDIMMLDALNNAYREFCRKSEALAPVIKIKNIVADKGEVLQPQIGHTILKIESVGKGNSLDSLYVGKDYTFDKTGTIKFNRNSEDVNIVAILLPLVDMPDDQADDHLINAYGEFIATGAAKQLRLMMGQPWSNPELAAMYDIEFTEGCREAYRDRIDGYNTFHNTPRKRDFF